MRNCVKMIELNSKSYSIPNFIYTNKINYFANDINKLLIY